MLRNRFAPATVGATLALALIACNRKEEVPASQAQTTSADMAPPPAAEVPAGAPNASTTEPAPAPEKGSSAVTTPAPARGSWSSGGGTQNWSTGATGARKDAGASMNGEGATRYEDDTRRRAVTPADDLNGNGDKAKGILAPEPYGGVAPGHIMYPPDPRGGAKGSGEPNSAGSHNIGGAE